MSLKSITPATDWVLVTRTDEPLNEVIAWRVAVWCIEEDKVIGLISSLNGGPDDHVGGRVPRLIGPPPLRSMYKHISELDELETLSLKTGKPVKYTV